MGNPFKSLQSRVVGWYALLLAAVLAVGSLVLFDVAWRYQRSESEQSLREELFHFEAVLEARPASESLEEAVRLFFANWPREEEEGLVVRIAGSGISVAGPIGAEPSVLAAMAKPGGGVRNIDTTRGEALVLVSPVTADGRTVGTMAAVHLADEDEARLLHALAILVGASLVAFALASSLAWLSVRRLLRPLGKITRTARSISSGDDLTRRMGDVGAADELGQLAETFDRMLDRVEGSFRRERRFIREASHELRTPITICRGHLETLSGDPKPEELRETLLVVLDELGRMARILDDMTTLARIEDPAFLRPETVSLEPFLAELTAKAEPLLDGRLRLAGAPKGVVRADPQRLTQALINLLDNAAAHGAGSVELRVVAERDGWRFEVVDDGAGLPPGREEELFRPFARVQPGRTAGHGLGLAIVRAVAESHGGSAGFDNRPGEGAAFWVRLPR